MQLKKTINQVASHLNKQLANQLGKLTITWATKQPKGLLSIFFLLAANYPGSKLASC